MQTEDLTVRLDGPAKLDIEIKSDWLLACFTFVMKSPGYTLVFSSIVIFLVGFNCHKSKLVISCRY